MRVVRHDRQTAFRLLTRDDPTVRPDPRRGFVAAQPVDESRIDGVFSPRRPPRRSARRLRRALPANDRRAVIETIGVEFARCLVSQPIGDECLSEGSKAPRERPGDLFLQQHRIHGFPGLGLVLEQRELDRRGIVGQHRVDTLGVDLAECTRLRLVEQRDVRPRRAVEVHLRVEDIRIERRVADDLREPPAHLPALEVHLEGAIACLRVADREVERVLVLGVDVGCSVVVVAHRGAPVRALDGLGFAFGRVPGRPRERREPFEIATHRRERTDRAAARQDRPDERAAREFACHIRPWVGRDIKPRAPGRTTRARDRASAGGPRG